MKKLIGGLITLAVVVAIGWFVYDFFIDCEKYTSNFGKYFTLKEKDQVTVEDEAIVKLVKINDKRYKEDGKLKGRVEK